MKRIKLIKKILLMNKECYFKGMNTKFDHKLFGEFFAGDCCGINSSILRSNESIDLMRLCGFNTRTTKFKLLYQSTRDSQLTTFISNVMAKQTR